MYKIRKEFEFEAAHSLQLDYESPCTRYHGHSYRCAATLQSKELDRNGMIIDFKELKKILEEVIDDQLDHRDLNEIFEGNATAEFLSRWICDQINSYLKAIGRPVRCVSVEVNETSRNKAIWEEN